uniref:Putative ovule protein n=1 Tax=Solanum chacoense TaxID=4108 RepID=A0A0V0ILR4_SOLCH
MMKKASIFYFCLYINIISEKGEKLRGMDLHLEFIDCYPSRYKTCPMRILIKMQIAIYIVWYTSTTIV